MIKTTKKAIVFLTTDLNEDTKHFIFEIIKKTNFDVFVIEDSQPKQVFSKIEISFCYDSKKYLEPVFYHLVQIDDSICRENGYHGCNIDDKSTHIRKSPIAWDKFLFAFCETYTSYEFVWVFEDDCFIPSIEALINLDNKYSTHDLVVPNNRFNEGNQVDWHWRSIYPIYSGPYYYSMVCACGISRALLNEIKKFKDENGFLFYIEVMFNSLAMKKELSVHTPLELKSIVWLGVWGLDEFLLLPNNIFHPKKDISQHSLIRHQINLAKENKDYIPIDNLPEFIKELM
jgi:hypothetical protein